MRVSNVLRTAAELYAMAHAPWPWQSRLRERLADAYVKGVIDTLAVRQPDHPALHNPANQPGEKS